MQRQLRLIVENSAKAIKNFFAGFMSLSELKKSQKPINKMRPAVTVYALPEGRSGLLSRSDSIAQLARMNDPKTIERMEKNRAYRHRMRAKRLDVLPARVAEIEEEELLEK